MNVEIFQTTNDIEKLEDAVKEFLNNVDDVKYILQSQSTYVLGEGDDQESHTKVTISIFYQ